MENDLDNMQLMKILELNGGLKIWDQEGGYAEPAVEIGDVSLTRAIQDYFNKELGLGKYGEPGTVKGEYRITIERIRG